MNKRNSIVLALGLMFAVSSCIPGEHNTAPNKGKNLDSERIYGAGEAKQLQNKYSDDPKAAERASAIREKLYK